MIFADRGHTGNRCPTARRPPGSTGAQVASIEPFIGDPLLFLVGHTLYRRALSQVVPVYRLAAICALLALVPVAVLSTAVLLALTTAVVVATAWLGSRVRT